MTITIAANTRVIFNNVGPNGARLTEGHDARITLAEGAKVSYEAQAGNKGPQADAVRFLS